MKKKQRRLGLWVLVGVLLLGAAGWAWSSTREKAVIATGGEKGRIDMKQWVEQGSKTTVVLPASKDGTPERRYEIFYRVKGKGPWLTLIHGFPTNSWDWDGLSTELEQDYSMLMFDLLGYGQSEKPKDHTYSIAEHADIAEALWKQLGIEKTAVLGHDVGTIVVQELLARQSERKPGAPALTSAVFLNGGVYSAHYQPVLITRLMQKPVIGPAIAKLMNKDRFGQSLAKVFAKDRPLQQQELDAYWEAMSADGGVRLIPKLLHYIPEKKQYRDRWEGALNRSPVPLRFIWGMDDPATGRVIMQDIEQLQPKETIVKLEGVGHFPQLEKPKDVAEVLRKLKGA